MAPFRAKTCHGYGTMQSATAVHPSVQVQAPPPPDPIYTLRPHSGEVTSLKFVCCDSILGLLSGTTSGQLSLWDLGTKRQCWTEACRASVLSVNHIPGKRLILSQLKDATVLIWDLSERRQQAALSIENPAFCQLSPFSEGVASSTVNSNCFAVADSKYGKVVKSLVLDLGGTALTSPMSALHVNVYDVALQKLAMNMSCKEPKGKGMCMCVQACTNFSSASAHVLGGFEDGTVVLWDCRNASQELSSCKLFTEPVMCLDVGANTWSGVCGSPLKTLEVFSITQDQLQLQKQYSVELRNPGVSSVRVRQDSKIVASGGWDGRVRVFGFKRGKPLALLNYHSATVNAVAFTPSGAQTEDSNLLACGSKDERISLWRLY